MLGTGLIFLLFAATANRVAQGAIAFLVIASVATGSAISHGDGRASPAVYLLPSLPSDSAWERLGA